MSAEQDACQRPTDGADLVPPAAYIIGAPKCGTTALAAYLAEHPDVAFSRPKEPHFFAGDLPGLRRTAEPERYRAMFAAGTGHSLAMEGSVWYLYSSEAVARIEAARPGARYIVMLRDPLAMLPSLHRQLLNALDEDETDFARAWDLSEARARGERVPGTCRAPSTLIYTRTAAFGAMIQRLFATVDRERCLIFFQEDMRRDTGAVYRRCLDFLDLPDDGRTQFPRVNEASRDRSRVIKYVTARGGPVREAISRPVKRVLGRQSLGILRRVQAMNTARSEAPPLSPALRDRIAAAYAEDLALLVELLPEHRDVLAGWLGRGSAPRM